MPVAEATSADAASLAEQFTSLPEDVLIQILAHLDPLSLDKAGQVCQHWHSVVSNDHSWLRGLMLTFSRRPFQRLQPIRMPSTRIDTPGWLVDGQLPATTWRSEYVDRLSLHKLWLASSATHQRRVEFNPRASTIDGLVVNESLGWVLAVSKVGRAAVRCLPKSGKVFARDDNIEDVVFAVSEKDSTQVSALTTRIDRIFWGMDDGRSVVTHLTRGGGLKSRVVAEQQLLPGISDIASPFDQLMQEKHDRAITTIPGGADDLVASAGFNGSVLVWSASKGETRHILHSVGDVPLTKVTWADGGRFVVAVAAEASAVFVWDLEAPADASPSALASAFERVSWLSPDSEEYVNGRLPPTAVFPVAGGKAASTTRLVLLTGDPYSKSFIVATEAGGVARMSVTGEVLATFQLGHAKTAGEQPAITLTAAAWKLDMAPALNRRPQQTAPEDTAALTQTPSSASLSEAGSERREVLHLDLTRATQAAQHGAATRLLMVGDATGSVWMFDGDGVDTVPALQRWPRLHQRAVAALTVNAAVAVSAGRDGQMFVLDPLTGRVLCVDRCRSGRRSDSANGQIDPWFWSVHPALRGEQTALEVRLAQQLAGRTATQWDRQTQGLAADALDRGRAATGNGELEDAFARLSTGGRSGHFPTVVSEVRAGYGWIVAANSMHIHASFAGLPGKTRRQWRPRRPERGEDIDQALEEGLEDARAELDYDRECRIREHETRTHVEREFEAPVAQLGLTADEQLAYALWLSTHDSGSDGADGSDQRPHAGFALEGMTEEEQVEYALRLSSSLA
ncbi:hypothetical protein LPJ61_001614 [Coemansia biformis]|uniref:F-box domain-containing protein n=1 Tax=Coemansia biformis TaxID=1286918 RepID=A0A9W7YE01_9FUNG|nr:hypothetical protein LPJ61_001614 [Coemansia biformis]